MSETKGVILTRETVLTPEEAACHARMSVDALEDHGAPFAYVGRKRVIVWGRLLDWLRTKEQAA